MSSPVSPTSASVLLQDERNPSIPSSHLWMVAFLISAFVFGSIGTCGYCLPASFLGKIPSISLISLGGTSLIISSLFAVTTALSRRTQGLAPVPVPEQPVPSPSLLNTDPPRVKMHKQISDARPLPLIQPQKITYLKENPFAEVIQELSQQKGDDLLGEEELCHYFSRVPLNFNQRRIVVLVKDAAGYGDSAFGLKILTLIREEYPGATVALASDNPWKAVQINDKQHGHPLLIPEDLIDPNTLLMEKVATLIQSFSCDFLLIGPVTFFDQQPLSSLQKGLPTLQIREYGFTERTYPFNGEEFVSGPGKPFVGMVVHSSLVEWSKSQEARDPIANLAHLKKLPEPISSAILGNPFSDEAVEEFHASSSLFCGYSADEETKMRFILAIITEQYQLLGSNKSLSFFFLGTLKKETSDFPHKYRNILKSLQVGSVSLIDLNEKTKVQITIDSSLAHHIRLFFCVLQPDDVISLMQSSEKEALSTGDQSWSECVSADKHWIQEYQIHKRFSMQSVRAVSRDLSKKGKDFSEFDTLLHSAYPQRQRIIDPADVRFSSEALYETHARLLYAARTKSAIAAAWSTFNHTLVDHNIKGWLMAKMTWKTLEKAHPQLFGDLSTRSASKEVTVTQLLQLFRALSSQS